MLDIAFNFTSQLRHEKNPPPLQTAPSTSIVVPTFREVEALPDLIDRVAKLRAEHGSIEELLIVDDDGFVFTPTALYLEAEHRLDTAANSMRLSQPLPVPIFLMPAYGPILPM